MVHQGRQPPLNAIRRHPYINIILGARFHTLEMTVVVTCLFVTIGPIENKLQSALESSRPSAHGRSVVGVKVSRNCKSVSQSWLVLESLAGVLTSTSSCFVYVFFAPFQFLLFFCSLLPNKVQSPCSLVFLLDFSFAPHWKKHSSCSLIPLTEAPLAWVSSPAGLDIGLLASSWYMEYGTY